MNGTIPPAPNTPFLKLSSQGSEARIFGLHLSSMFSKWGERRRVREIRALLKGIEQHQHGFHVLVGDFNTLAPGEVLDVRRMPAWIRGSGLVKRARHPTRNHSTNGRLELHRRLSLLHPVEKGYTFPVWDPHLRLDYVFVPRQFAERLVSCSEITEPAVAGKASDHFPLLADLEF